MTIHSPTTIMSDEDDFCDDFSCADAGNDFSYDDDSDGFSDYDDDDSDNLW